MASRRFIPVPNPLFWLNPLALWRLIVARAVIRARKRAVARFVGHIVLAEIKDDTTIHALQADPELLTRTLGALKLRG